MFGNRALQNTFIQSVLQVEMVLKKIVVFRTFQTYCHAESCKFPFITAANKREKNEIETSLKMSKA